MKTSPWIPRHDCFGRCHLLNGAVTLYDTPSVLAGRHWGVAHRHHVGGSAQHRTGNVSGWLATGILGWRGDAPQAFGVEPRRRRRARNSVALGVCKMISSACMETLVDSAIAHQSRQATIQAPSEFHLRWVDLCIRDGLGAARAISCGRELVDEHLVGCASDDASEQWCDDRNPPVILR